MPDETPFDRTEVQVGGPTVTAATARGFPIVPGYEIVRELGRGGMGVVYEAKQLKLDRRVALKLMLGRDPLNKARFLAEGQVIAAVKHPHVVEVYDFGEAAAGPYIAMEYLAGGTFADRVRGGAALAAREAAEQLAKIAAGVGAAHGQGVVHRDLKPGNVLLASDGAPKVTDFGLAKRSTSELTMTQDAAGTPAYMAPEQARAMKFVRPPADVWSLGVMLYEALTGKRPFVADTDMQLLISIQESNPPTLRSVSSRIPRDLETVCLKCLEKEPERRYPTAKELAADLGAWLDGRPIAAKRASGLERAWLWTKRKPVAATAYALGGVAVGLLAWAILSTAQRKEAESARTTAEQQTTQAKTDLSKEEQNRKDAETKRQQAEADRQKEAEEKKKAVLDKGQAETERDVVARRESLRAMNQAHREYSEGEVGRARELLTKIPTPLRAWEWYYVHRACHPMIRRFDDVLQDIAAVSPDGTRFASGSRVRPSALIRDAKTGAAVRELTGHDKELTAIAYSTAGDKIVTGSADLTAKIWDANSGQLLQTLKDEHRDQLSSVAFDRDGRRVVTGGGFDGDAVIWDVATGGKLVLLRDSVNGPAVLDAKFSPDGSHAVTAGSDGRVRIWDAKTGKKLHELVGHAGLAFSACYSPDGEYILSAGSKGGVIVWNVETKMESYRIKANTEGVFRAIYSPDGKHIALTEHVDRERGVVVIWDVYASRRAATLDGHGKFPNALSYTSDGKTLVSSSADSVIVWDAAGGENSTSRRYYFSNVGGPVVRAASDAKLVEGRYHREAKAWSTHLADPATSQTLSTFADGGSPISHAELSSDGSKLVTITLKEDKLVKIWDTKTGAVVRSMKGPAFITEVLAFSGDDKRVVACDSTTAVVWDANSGAALLTFEPHGLSDIYAAKLNRDGSKLVTGGQDKTAKVWDIPSGRELTTLKGHTESVNSTSFDADGRRILTASDDGTARVWDAATGGEVAKLTGHQGPVHVANFSPDGMRIVTGGEDQTVKLWDAATGVEILTLKWHTQPVKRAFFSRDGWRIITGCASDPYRVWDATPVSESFPVQTGHRPN